MYTGYFGFNRSPFADSDDQAGLFDLGREPTRSCLIHNLVKGRAIVVLSGLPGVGKTTILRQMMAQFEGQAHFVFIWNPYLSFDDLLNYLCHDLGLDATGPIDSAKLQTLEVCLVERLAHGQRIVLVLDDAQELPTETLAGLHHLLQLRSASQRLLQIVLCGQPTLATRLTNEAALRYVASDIDARCNVSPLDDDAVAHYVRERLRVAGHRGGEIFDVAAVDKIIRYSHGVPRRINRICGQALMLAYLNSERHVSGTMIREVAVDGEWDEADDTPTAATQTTVVTEAPAPAPEPPSAEPGSTTEPRISTVDHSASDLEFPARNRTVRRHRGRSRRRHPWLAAVLILVAVSGALFVAFYPDLPSSITQILEIPDALRRQLTTEPATEIDPNDAVPPEIMKPSPQTQKVPDTTAQIRNLRSNNNDGVSNSVPGVKSSLLSWADSAEARGDLSMARDYLETALGMDPSDAAVRTRLEALAETIRRQTTARID